MSAEATPGQLPTRIFVTGADGFVGRELVRELASRGCAVRGLVRRNGGTERTESWRAGSCQRVAGDLLEPDAWQNALAGCQAVLHLAACTGRAPARRYFETNVEGTRLLLAACAGNRVPRLLFVSSIAARFPNQPDYPYARSKEAAERLVLDAEMASCVARPTLVVGPGSGPMKGLSALAGLPVLPLPGGGGARIQPIWVGDLVARFCQILEKDRFAGEILELGGPESLTIADLLHRMRRREGRSPRSLPLPAGPLLLTLALAEKIIGPRLPVTAGQLASFLHDGTVRSDPRLGSPSAGLRSVDEMLEMSQVR